MRNQITNSVIVCSTCQLDKRKTSKKFGHLREKETEAISWDKTCIAIIGPYTTIQRKGQANLVCKCVTMINPATSWFKIRQYNDKPAITAVAIIAEEEWFSRYPWPTQVTFDCGSEFIGHEFKKLLNDCGVKKKPITSRNPQANAIVKRVHQTTDSII
jgi:hypothetical protein